MSSALQFHAILPKVSHFDFRAVACAWLRPLPGDIQMSTWGRSIELSKVEAQLLVELVSHAVVKQITHHNTDPDMVSLLKKATKVLQSFNQQNNQKGQE